MTEQYRVKKDKSNSPHYVWGFFIRLPEPLRGFYGKSTLLRSYFLATLLFFVSSSIFGAENTGHQELPQIYKAIESGDIEWVKSWVDSIKESRQSVDSPLDNVPDGNPLMYAIQCGQLKIADLLLSSGADPNRMSGAFVPLVWALCSLRDPTLRYAFAKLLLEYGAAANHPGPAEDRTPLQIACYLGQIELVRLLLCADADVNALSFETALTSSSDLTGGVEWCHHISCVPTADTDLQSSSSFRRQG